MPSGERHGLVAAAQLPGLGVERESPKRSCI